MQRFVIINIRMNRPICPACNRNPVAINYRKGNRVHYRTRCQSCINKNRNIRPPVPRWHIAGYVKKLVCDICKFRAKYPAQIQVYHRDGNLNNCELNNLRSVCLNCGIILQKQDSAWQTDDLGLDV